MRIGLFADTFMPQINGVATSVMTLKEYLERLGNEVFIFTTTDPHAPKNEERVFRLPSMRFLSERRVGLFYHPMVARTVKALGLDIIHTHTEFSMGIFGRGMARALGIPQIHTMHTKYEDYTHYIVKFNMLDPVAKSVARRLSMSFCNNASGVIAPTNKVRDMLIEYGVNKSIYTIPTGIEMDKFDRYSNDGIADIRKEIGLREDDKVILYVGRISEEKNINEVFTSLKDYLPKRDNVKIVLVGDGPERSNLEHLAKKLDIGGQVVFAGEKPWEDIERYYQLGDLFVSASQSETQGLTYIEALASGVPVVAKKDPCLNDIIFNGVNGYQFEGRDDIIGCVDRVLFSEGHRESLSEGAKRTSHAFSAEHFAQSVESCYNDLLFKPSAVYAC